MSRGALPDCVRFIQRTAFGALRTTAGTGKDANEAQTSHLTFNVTSIENSRTEAIGEFPEIRRSDNAKSADFSPDPGNARNRPGNGDIYSTARPVALSTTLCYHPGRRIWENITK